MFSKVLLISLVPAILGGCALWPTKSRDGCEPLIKTSVGSFSVAGIEIPTGTPIPVKIGNATYTPQQIQRLTDSAQQMEQYRLGQCSVLSTLERLKPQPVDKIADIASKIAQLNLDLQRLFRELPKATEPEKQVQSTEKAATEALKEQKTSQAPSPRGADDKLGTSEQPTSSLLQQLSELTARVQELTNITAKLRLEQKSPPPASRELRPSEIVVVGFSSGSHEMSTRMKANLLADLTSRLSETPRGKSILLDVLGYSDTIGQNDKNAVLALRRAQAVASFLTEQQAIPRARLRSVSSAGAVEIPPSGRQVRILLNPTFFES
jgi:outer membrane protein OmpA-like peptidoglycan-associated protein